MAAFSRMATGQECGSASSSFAFQQDPDGQGEQARDGHLRLRLRELRPRRGREEAAEGGEEAEPPDELLPFNSYRGRFKITPY